MGDLNGIIDKWADDAVRDLGESSWREVQPNCMMLIIYAAQKADSKKATQKITRPFWWLLGIISPGIIWFIIEGVASHT